jgi:hypothetical protein
MEFVKFLEKILRLHRQIRVVMLKMTSYRTMSKKQLKKNENPRLYGQNKLFFGTISFNPWAILATMIHIGAPQRIQGK